ncbi:MAG: NAD(P)/FAD-dependent oxidoreductase [Enterobacteriaceae bacterium]
MPEIDQEEIPFDVVIVGAGPAGLSAACRIKQKAAESGQEITVCVVEKGSEVGAHTLSGAIFDPRALSELFPDWQQKGAPVSLGVQQDNFYWLSETKAFRVPHACLPAPMRNQGYYIISLGLLCRWLAEQAEALGVEIYPSFAAQALLKEGPEEEQGRVCGIYT